MKTSWRTEWPHWLLLAGMFLLAAITWPSAPERIPIHWGLSGQADRFGGRLEGLLLLPLLALGLYALLLWLPRIDPGRANYPAFAGAYSLIRLAVLIVLVIVYGFIHLWIRGYQADVGVVMGLAVGGLFIVLGSVLGKVRPNAFIGVRTPWTFASRLAWTKTHRLAGWVFLGEGVLMLIAGLLHAPWALIATLGALAVGVIGLVVYSYVVWRNDPDKIPALDSRPIEEA